MHTLLKSDLYSDEPEKQYLLESDPSKRKKFAQFFTPYPVAKFMGKWITSNPDCKKILDPALGLGIFFRSIVEDSKLNYDFYGFDLDPSILKFTKSLFDGFSLPNRFTLKNLDYISGDWAGKYDGIIANPPYLKFHNYENKEMLSILEKKSEISLSKMANIYTLFILKSCLQLNLGGRCAYIVPSEFLNSDYGVSVKNYLISHKLLRYVIVFNFKNNIFDSALTTSSILLFSNDTFTDKVKFLNVNSVNDLDNISNEFLRYPNLEKSSKSFSFKELNPEIKWRFYYQRQESNKFKNLIPFSAYAKVVRGIATGDNDYFTFNTTKIKDTKIPEKYFLPCITKANYSKNPFFTLKSFNELKNSDKKVFLLNAFDLSSKHLKDYISHGESVKVDQKYLTSHRSPWYSLENRPPSPIWVSVFNRNGLRFVRNEANISNLTSFHCVYLNKSFQQNIDLLFAYLLTDVSAKIFSDNRREYGGGLEKFEPNDLNNSMILNLSLISLVEEKRILSLLAKFKKECSFENVKYKTSKSLSEINQIFLSILNK